ncbi:transcription factor domain-containing protein [Aspergillus melleus]|uniref:transcription factor domain-containing protein n=1 Tax=Aspergillus melleus TaxID=138277 RepID=UPI001E8CED17|nr:uncharacterized protein LDX57_000273 [Aspergillus melleus]KAH8422519.1 hypothetical protein LDX57_000273 [Aspergillus melleus]
MLSKESGDGDQDDDSSSMSVSDVDSETHRSLWKDDIMAPVKPIRPMRGAIYTLLNRLKKDDTKALLWSTVFCQLPYVGFDVFDHEVCRNALENAVAEIQLWEDMQDSGLAPTPSSINKERAARWINLYFDGHQFEAFRVPLDRKFLLSIPDLREIPHVQLDATSQILYYSALVQGLFIDPEPVPNRSALVRDIYLIVAELADSWVNSVQITVPDLYASFFVLSTALENCKTELAWRSFGHTITIARALGYLTVDADTEVPNQQGFPEDSRYAQQVSKNRMRFEFWHLLRMDCVFRLHFGKPALITAGSWAVNFPDPSINGVTHMSTRYIQIHFLASMRLTLVLLKYLDLLEFTTDDNSATFDESLDSLITEVESIMRNWNADELFSNTNNHIDLRFCMDIFVSCYKMLIMFHQSKKDNQANIVLSERSLEVARASMIMIQKIVGSSTNQYWGISIYFMYEAVPFFILCWGILADPTHKNAQADLGLMAWLGCFVERTSLEQTEKKPISIMLKAIITCCRNVMFDA